LKKRRREREEEAIFAKIKVLDDERKRREEIQEGAGKRRRLPSLIMPNLIEPPKDGSPLGLNNAEKARIRGISGREFAS
jgi:hypothetical protein